MYPQHSSAGIFSTIHATETCHSKSMSSRATSSLIPQIGDEKIVSALWERFVRDGALPAGGVRNVVLDSWRRCRSEAVDPARGFAPAANEKHRVVDLRERNRNLYEAAQPVLDSLREILRESGTLIMLTDPLGTILDLHGDSRARSAGETINLAAGGCWVEDIIGTNAIGTALASRQAVQIYGSEHYCIDVKRWTCAAAPIFDGYGKTLLGAIDVSGVKETFHGHTLGLVIAAAKQIQSMLLSRDLDLQGRLLDQAMDVFTRYASDCVILFDQTGRMVRSNGRMQAAREQHGIRLPIETGSRIAEFDLTGASLQPDAHARYRLQAEWLQPIRNREGRIGTALVIPLTAPLALPAVARKASGSENTADAFGDMIGSSAAMVAVKARAMRLAPLDLPILLLGETGAGKEIVASCIHKSGPRAAAPFVAVNCGALTRELLASELFGYAEGAFTGARRGGFPGKFEQADGGTLFLDEIAEMPLDLQPHLLRVLQDGVVVRLGDTRERRVVVRIIAATNRDLQGEVKRGRFREDLYHRLCVTSLRLPALRERADDIPVIVDHMNLRFAAKYGCAPRKISADVLLALQRYAWPGNVRELKNVFEAMFALCDGDVIDASQLPIELAAPGVPSPNALAVSGSRLDELERHAVTSAIARSGGNMSQAARSLGISRSTLYVKLAAIKQPTSS